MGGNDPVQGFGLTCPSGSTFYVCENDHNRFIGCCGVDPCGARKGLCPDQHLHQASFDKAWEEYIPPQACTNDNVDVAWHVCSWSTSSFIGCCAVDPCSSGCPSRQLRAAKLSDNAKDAQFFLGDGYVYPSEPSYAPRTSLNPITSTTRSTTAAITAISSFSTSYTLDRASEADTSTTEPAGPSRSSGHSKGHHCLSAGDIAGIVIGILVFFSIPALCWYWKGRSLKNRAKVNPNDTKTRESTPSVDSSTLFDSRDRSSPIQQLGQSNTPEAPDQNRRRQMQQRPQYDASPHGHMNQSQAETWAQQRPEVSLQSQPHQVPNIPGRSCSPATALRDLLRPPESSNFNMARKPVPGHTFELHGSSTPDPAPMTASLRPSSTESTGTPRSSYGKILGPVRPTNGYASTRSSNNPDIGTVTNEANKTPTPGTMSPTGQTSVDSPQTTQPDPVPKDGPSRHRLAQGRL
ncbi:hypothetical protein NXS19_008554 [Fusarium pseudograminearum]|uniref:Uncharacterized protein n=1 Tax=Fusarium pseudograminearum (strain CS3096) TaxID=1028729 RepID=K3VK89_FUSPC|nr:hypothetical protein FPSE_04895 [Fusarium pseudograminearum CS3096]EKJ74859.1 hypothetical protein FPSE_04895 [Fusarium pseudograminearum CS3096]KAF0644874.1 hypothetical protein FPSE5266_04895 [Fusarium pseudograminearum]UZP40738.1 hypothetical protein NXS19_008554 [Fusarium pseudograminearum]